MVAAIDTVSRQALLLFAGESNVSSEQVIAFEMMWRAGIHYRSMCEWATGWLGALGKIYVLG